jgi:hypothetical protein
MDCTWADAGIVDQDVDAAKPIAGGLRDRLGRGVAGQIRLDGEQLARFPMLTRTCRKGLKGSRSRSIPATRMPAANKPRTIALPMPPAAPATIATL